MGDEGAHAARLGEGQRFTVVGLPAFGIEPVGMGRDVAEQVQSMGRVSGLTWRRFYSAVAQVPRLFKTAEEQGGAPQRVIGPAEMKDESPCRLNFNKLLALPQPVQRLARPAELRQNPGGGGDSEGKREGDVPGPERVDPPLDQWTRLRPVTFEEVEGARGVVSVTDGERMASLAGPPRDYPGAPRPSMPATVMLVAGKRFDIIRTDPQAAGAHASRGASCRIMPGVDDIERKPKDVETSAWKAAEAYGFDMSLIEANLRRTPAERIRAHARALALAIALQQQMNDHRAGP